MRSITAAASPAVVAVGGGHGLACSLLGARHYAGSITAVVSVADDGGSSGRLREQLGIPAPGDVRKCLVALAPQGSALAAALDHRFAGWELEGHAFGNLLLAALAATTGDFTAAVAEVARLLGVVGTVLPATVGPVDLRAETEDGVLEGQVRINAARGLRRLSLLPADAEVPDAVLDAVGAADQVVIGPGSLYTSVLAACVPPALAKAIAASRAQRVYVCNLRQQAAETSGYDATAHLEALLRHGVPPDVVLVDPASMPLGRLAGDQPPTTGDGPAYTFEAHLAAGGDVPAWHGTVLQCRLGQPGAFEHDPRLLGDALRDCLATAGGGPGGSP